MLLEIYFLGIRNNKNMRAKVIRETYLIDGLKTKMLLETDIIEPKRIDIITFKN